MPTKIEKIKAKELRVDSRVQRGVEETHVRRLVKEWDDLQVGVLYGSRRTNGMVYLVDGLQRTTAMMRIDPEYRFTVQVHEDLTLKDEAHLFIGYNKHRKAVAPYFIHVVDVTLGEPRALKIEEVVTSLGLQTGTSNNRTTVGCIAALNRIIDGGSDVDAGGESLRFALSVYTQAYGSGAYPMWRSEVVEGLSQVHRAHGKAVNAKTFAAKLRRSKVGSDPLAILAVAKSRAVGSNRVTSQVRDVLIEVYDAGRTTHRLRPQPVD